MSQKDIRKFNPVNIIPEKLFAAPTRRVQGELLYLSGQLATSFNAIQAEPRIGSEFEVIFFSPDIDPCLEPIDFDERPNHPNYTSYHVRQVNRVLNAYEELSKKRPNEYLLPESVGDISLEFKTAPQSYHDHLQSVFRLADFLRSECRSLKIRPVVYSQHNHVSLISNRRNIFGRRRTINGVELTPLTARMCRTYSYVNPMVLLPEEWDYRISTPFRYNADHIQTRSDLMSSHLEFRKLSSEFAADPVLNLMVSLLAMYEGFVNRNHLEESFDPVDFTEGVDQMKANQYLQNFFGSSTLHTICKILRQYPDVSQRKITLDQVQ